MAALDIEDRKRPLDVEVKSQLDPSSKRPHLDRSNSSYISNGSPFDIKQEHNGGGDDAEDEVPPYKGLEAFRKEAIFRKMREAQRDLVRAEEKVHRLQDQVNQSEEKCTALNTFWNTLVEDVEILIQDGKIPNEDHSALTDAIALSTRKPSTSAFTLSLQERNASMKSILALIVSLTPGSHPDIDELQAKCHQLAEESASLRARYHRATEDRDSLVDELDVTIERLRKLERMHDRLHSATVKATERPGAEAEEEAERAKVEAAEAERKAAMKRKEAAENEMQGEGEVNGVQDDHVSAELAEKLEDAEKLAESRLKELDHWRNEIAILRRENEALKAELQNIPPEKLAASDIYRELHRLYEVATSEHSRLLSINQKLEIENTELRENRQEFESKARAEATSLVDELRTAVKTHEGDVARLRGQRDEVLAELTEKKQKESVKYAQIDEAKALSQVKDKRIHTLKTEVKRLQLVIAAKNGDDAWADQLRSTLTETEKEEADANIEMISILQSRLKAAEENVADLQRQLQARASSTSEDDLAARVSTLQAELDQLKGIIDQASVEGEESNSVTSDGISALLRIQSQLLEQTKRELNTANASTTALCDELDKLGAAYGEAQEIAGTRIADLGRMEEKLARLITEKAKADNKYFSAMRAKDAVDNEKRVVVRNIERQARALEKYAETEKNWQDQIQKYENEVTALRKFFNESNAKMTEINAANVQLKDQLVKIRNSNQETIALSNQRTSEYLEESKQRSAAQERCEKLQRELDKTRKQLASSSGGAGSRKKGSSFATDDQVEALNSLLRCSACKDRYRNRIITRCLHTFCNDCVDARIQTRQRKCPSCGLGFSTSDVQTLFFQ